jgi:hypothetical protein
MKLTKEQKDKLADELNMPWAGVHLLCDGYRVSLQVQRSKGSMVYRVMTFVNGVFRGEWVSGTETHPEQKFLRKSVRLLCSPAQKAKAEKAFGKRWVAKDPYYTAKLTLFMPDWASGKTAISHLCKVCDSVEIITDGAATL